MPASSDRDLLIRAFLERRGDLIAYIRAIGGAGIAEDAFQETFLVVDRRLGDFRPDGDFHAWVRGIARNTVRSLARRSGRLRSLPDDSLCDLIDRAAGEDPAPHAGVEALRACLSRLGPEQRRLLALRYGEERPIADIAGLLGRSAGAIQVALSRLRSLLADCMARRGVA